MYTKNLELGEEVRDYLILKNVESPAIFTNSDLNKNLTKQKQVETKIAELLQLLGLDMSNQSVIKTPSRVSKFFINELFYGLNYANFPQITTMPNEYNYKSPVFSEAVCFNSTCEHHLAAIVGHAYIAYIPKDKIIGLSKINRIVDFFARRPQVQERVTRQILFALQYIMATEDIAVLIRARHHCIAVRGVCDQNTTNLTVEFAGRFGQEEVLQNEMYNLARSARLYIS